jgi:glycosyltransferase involved in cell wall biosynthesis
MSDGADIDVIVPVRDGAAFLAAAIRSALAQLPGVAVTVVDDGSTDGSAAIAAACGAAVRVAVQAPTGAAAARNRGLAMTSRPLVAFLDADDLLPAGSLACRRAHLAATGADAACGRIVEFADPSVAGRAQPRPGPLEGQFLGATLIRRGAFERVGVFSEALRAGDYIDWVLRARACGIVFASMEDVVLERRLHARNMTRDRSLIGRDYLTILRRHLSGGGGGPPPSRA